jgi:hypothetical protein
MLVRTHEISGVGDADRLLPLRLDRLVGADGGKRLDRRGVEAAVHDPPAADSDARRRDRPHHTRRAALVTFDLDQRHQIAQLVHCNEDAGLT